MVHEAHQRTEFTYSRRMNLYEACKTNMKRQRIDCLIKRILEPSVLCMFLLNDICCVL